MATTAARAICLARGLELLHVWEAVGAYLDHSARWTIERAAAHGHKYLVQHIAITRPLGDDQEVASLVMDFAARNGHLDILQWLNDTKTLNRCSTRAMDDAAKNGYLAIVQWLHENRQEGCTVKAMDGAAMNGHLDVLQWLHLSRKEGCTKKAMDLAAQNGRLDVLEWLDSHRHEGCSPLAVEYAATEGQLDVVKWLCEHRKMEGAPTAMVKAARHGHLATLEYLGQRFPDVFESVGAKMVHAAIANGHVALMTWLISVLPLRALKCEGDSYSWLDVAAEFGQVAILQWFSEHTSELPVGVQIDGHLPACSPEAIEKAAGNGHIHVLDFLHGHEMVEVDSQDDAVKAIQAAVQGGHRDCVEWLVHHFQRHLEEPEASTAVMDTAAASGHVEILAFMRACVVTSSWHTSAKAVNEAARLGWIDVLQWLHQHEVTGTPETSELWTPRALECAAANGHLRVVQWLVANRCTECRSSEALNSAAYMDHLEIAQFLYREVRSSCSVVQALEHAEEGGAEETLAWLESLSPQDRP
ncbi:hypothetical protein Poli38472_007903 [Pythium oligandrum]|uniref:Ankyrin repeat protein n=1 Tax=Pythium oligandrum TaxID=41045 RepID=A0A8K1CTA4_PYTOL|nr:hypothetical protein Poli38472_007903 [Pythium oligandrum]|eukprot:TMW68231.1 hypothetical protein Poli38472_007903 [Pythium oligandrum]